MQIGNQVSWQLVKGLMSTPILSS